MKKQKTNDTSQMDILIEERKNKDRKQTNVNDDCKCCVHAEKNNNPITELPASSYNKGHTSWCDKSQV